MKKALLSVAIVVLFLLTSCNKEGAKCYKVTYTAGVIGVGAEGTVYLWLNDDDIEAQRAKYVAEGFTDIVFTEMEGYTTSATCIALGNISELVD